MRYVQYRFGMCVCVCMHVKMCKLRHLEISHSCHDSASREETYEKKPFSRAAFRYKVFAPFVT